MEDAKKPLYTLIKAINSKSDFIKIGKTYKAFGMIEEKHGDRTIPILSEIGLLEWKCQQGDYEVIERIYEAEIIPASPSYYDNTKGSLYKVATERNWNTYLFDVVKRLERGGKKDPLEQEIEKSVVVLQLWLKELKEVENGTN